MHRLNPVSPIDPAFSHIAPSIHFRNPKTTAADSDSESTVNLNSPDLILLFTWTGAKPQHLAQYTSAYTQLFPSSPIMIITSSLNDFVPCSSAKKRRSLIAAILTILTSRLASNVLVHCFAESGAHKAVQFAKLFRKLAGHRFPLSALCLDSGRGTLGCAQPGPTRRWNTAVRTPLSQTLTSFLAYTLSPSCWTTYPVICDAFADDSKHLVVCDRSRRALNDPGLWNVCAPRCYLFSNSDKLTDPRSVLEHSRSAEKLGARLFLTRFQSSDQVDRVGAAVYWATIRRTWDAGTGSWLGSDIHPIDAEKTTDPDIHISVHELASSHSPVDRVSQNVPHHPLPESSSVYSADTGNLAAAAAAAAAVAPPAAAASLHSYRNPSTMSTMTHKRRWYDCLGPVPAYQGWGGIGADSYIGVLF